MDCIDRIAELKKEIYELSEKKNKLFDIAPKTSNLKNAPIEPSWFKENILPISEEIEKRMKEIERLRSSELNPSNKL